MKDEPANTKSTSGIIGNASRQVTADERRRMIAEAAYFRALERKFEGGDVLEDWCTAEIEIDQRLLAAADPASGIEPRAKSEGMRPALKKEHRVASTEARRGK